MTIERSQEGMLKGGQVQPIGKRLADRGAKLSETVSFPEWRMVRTMGAHRHLRESGKFSGLFR
jgi:hypothetical protein